jgi:hypothetical protein
MTKSNTIREQDLDVINYRGPFPISCATLMREGARTASGHLQERKRSKARTQRGAHLINKKDHILPWGFLSQTSAHYRNILPFKLLQHVHLKYFFDIGGNFAVATKGRLHNNKDRLSMVSAWSLN